MSRFLLLTLIICCGLALSGCAETEYVSHFFKRSGNDTNYASAQGNYQGNDAPSGSRLQQNGFKIGKPYEALGKTYTPTESYSYDESGIASWYGPGFHGKRTANGEPYDSYTLTAAHPTLQLPCIARVTNLDNGRSVVVRVNDRGPFKRGRVMDVSKRAAELLGMIGAGTAKVRVQVLDRESRIVADAARRGLSPQNQMAMLSQQGDEQPTETEVASADTSYGTMTDVAPAAALPAAQVAQTDLNDFSHQTVRKFPVHDTNIFVQVGSFGNAGNAQLLANKLVDLGPTRLAPAMVNGRTFSRVQIGPVANVEQADRLLAKTIKSGYPAARIVVE